MVLNRQGPWTRPAPQPQHATSKCMTCGLLMRYPNDVASFRCTVCVTINELCTLHERAAERDLRREELVKAKRKGKQVDEAEITQHTVKPLNVAFTQHVIDDCLRAYMIAKFCKDHGSGPREPPRRSRWENQEPTPYSNGEPSSSARDGASYEAKYHFSSEPTLRTAMHALDVSAKRASSGMDDEPMVVRTPRERRSQYYDEEPNRIFRPVRDYIARCFESAENINHSFLTENATRPTINPVKRASGRPSRSSRPASEDRTTPASDICEVEPKLLMLGDVAKNGSWWLGQNKREGPSEPSRRGNLQPVTLPPEKTPSLDFSEIQRWYNLALNAAGSWDAILSEVHKRSDWGSPSLREIQKARTHALRASSHLTTRLLKISENLLKRFGGRITQPEELRFLLFILENPLLDGEITEESIDVARTRLRSSDTESTVESIPHSQRQGPVSGRHSCILKRIMGILANCPAELHPHLVSWFSHYDKTRFIRVKDITSGFLTYRLIRQDKKASNAGDGLDDLLPSLPPGSNIGTLHEQLKQGSKMRGKISPYFSDWQVRSCAQVLAFLFEANNPHSSRHALPPAPAGWKPSLAQGVFLPMSDFYVSMIDCMDLVADFEEFGKKGGKFTFCQYPFLMSVWAKTQVLEYDSKRQMKETARDAFFDNLLRQTHSKQTLTLDVRRECLADDSLKAIAKTMGSVSNESKKALRIKFTGEEGIDGGGLRKEWFLLLVREVFNPGLGLFEYDEDSQYCYFNPHTLDSGDQFYLVGVILGLAIYNSTILDVPLPPFVFRKLVSMSPMATQSQTNSLTQVRRDMTNSLSDLSQYKPRLARGLRQLLDFEGDVESTFLRTFVVEVERYGSRYEVPLCKDGERKPVTSKNRREYVDLYVRYVLDTAVARQFEPFKRGFYQVCSGSAFGLFRPEEVELLVRGSDEPLDVATLRGVAVYDEWGTRNPDCESEQVVWFWELFIDAVPQNQRKLLSFITGSDRVPAAGASMMPLTITCLGDDADRLPVARTCFNRLSLWRYASKEKMSRLLWLAVHESEGFGLQ